MPLSAIRGPLVRLKPDATVLVRLKAGTTGPAEAGRYTFNVRLKADLWCLPSGGRDVGRTNDVNCQASTRNTDAVITRADSGSRMATPAAHCEER